MCKKTQQNTTKGMYADTIFIVLCLSLLGGFLDAYSYLLKGGVFANAQTGNVVLLFIALSNMQFYKCIKYIIPVVTFAVGIFIFESIKHRQNNNIRLTFALSVEFVLILCVGIFGVYISNYAVNCIISFIAAIQVANFDKIDGNPVATTMITGNLKSSMIQLSRYLQTKEKAAMNLFKNYLLIIIGFGCGVIMGCIAIKKYAEKSIFVCALLLILVFLLIKTRQNRLQKNASPVPAKSTPLCTRPVR
ncbi:MAG: YoaK family protein [Treponema sp.]